MKRTSMAVKIQEQWRDKDGYWVALRSGWGVLGEPGLHTAHEDTKKEALDVARSAVPCNCADCKADAENAQQFWIGTQPEPEDRTVIKVYYGDSKAIREHQENGTAEVSVFDLTSEKMVRVRRAACGLGCRCALEFVK